MPVTPLPAASLNVIVLALTLEGATGSLKATMTLIAGLTPEDIVAGKRLVPELIQQDATPQNIADAVSKMLRDPDYYKAITDGLATVRVQMGDAGASARAADVVLELLKIVA